MYIYIPDMYRIIWYLVVSPFFLGGAGEVAQAVGRLRSQGPHAETHPGDGVRKRTGGIHRNLHIYIYIYTYYIWYYLCLIIIMIMIIIAILLMIIMKNDNHCMYIYIYISMYCMVGIMMKYGILMGYHTSGVLMDD